MSVAVAKKPQDISIQPVTVEHSAINMLRSPYKKRRPALRKTNAELVSFQDNFDILFDTFFEPYIDYKKGRMPQEKDAERERFGIPTILQYKAFDRFIKVFEDEEYIFSNPIDVYYWYDMNLIAKIFNENDAKNENNANNYYNMAVIEYLHNMINFDFDANNIEKKVIITSGSFWYKVPALRKLVINYLKQLHEKKVKIFVYMQAKKDEDADMQELSQFVAPESQFGLTERIPIHYILLGNNYLLFEFPHTEDIIVRLDMFMNLAEMKYKDGKTKRDAVQLLNTLIHEVLPKNAKR